MQYDVVLRGFRGLYLILVRRAIGDRSVGVLRSRTQATEFSFKTSYGTTLRTKSVKCSNITYISHVFAIPTAFVLK
jgi:hypothetical protein